MPIVARQLPLPIDKPKVGVPRQCLHCGIVFTPRYRGNKNWYCSRRCGAFDGHDGQTILRICRVCGADFAVKRSDIENGRGNYCSRLCWHRRPKQSEQRVCEVCGEAFSIYPRSVRRGEAGRYCSPECFGLAHRGVNHPGYRGGGDEVRTNPQGYQWRKDVLARDRHTCTRCGCDTGKLCAHHIKPWATHPELRYDVTNGITLCEQCHIEHHRNHPV